MAGRGAIASMGCHQHPWRQGVKAEQQGDTGDAGLDSTSSSQLFHAPGRRLCCCCPMAQLRNPSKRAGKRLCVCARTSAGGIRTLMAPGKAFLLLTAF